MSAVEFGPIGQMPPGRVLLAVTDYQLRIAVRREVYHYVAEESCLHAASRYTADRYRVRLVLQDGTQWSRAEFTAAREARRRGD